MTLLRFSAENHKCFRDRFELDLVSSSLKTQRPLNADWTSVVHPVAGIFGANASGKSTVLDALRYAREAVQASASEWLSRKAIPRSPFRLDNVHAHAPSTYVFDLVIHNVRHEYGFIVSGQGIDAEWLIDYPTGRRRLIFDRAAKRKDSFEFGRAFERPAAIAGAVSPYELLLSRGALLDHAALQRVATAITDEIELALHGERHQEARIGSVIDAVDEGIISPVEILTLLRVADLGIERVEASEELTVTPRDLFEALASVDRNRLAHAPSSPPQVNDLAGELTRQLEFFHSGQRGQAVPAFSLKDESTGTVSWLSLAVLAILAVRRGSLLAVDEIDASLHPHLSSSLIGLFQDRTLNTLGAQLVFTSHDTYLLARQAEGPLSSEQIWFTQKQLDGTAELFSLSDFTNRKSENIAKRYLAGRYGAVPRPAPSLFASLLDRPARGA